MIRRGMFEPQNVNLHTVRVTCSNYYMPSWHGKLARVSRRIFLSLSLLPPEIKKNTAGSRDYIASCYPFSSAEEISAEILETKLYD